MKKIIKTKPIEKIVLEFENTNDNVELLYNNFAFATLDEEFENGSISILLNSFKKPYGEGWKVIYAGMKAIDNSVTHQKAKNIISSIEYMDIVEILEKVLSFFGGEENEKKQKEVSQKDIQRVLKMLNI